MPYLNVDLDYFTHRKTVRLVGILGRGAEVLPIKLWSYCGKYHAESGKLTSYGPDEIEAAAGWWGEKGRALEALMTVGFLEKDRAGNFQVHDWLEHAGHLAAFKKRAKTAAKKRWSKYASSIASSKDKQCPSRGVVKPSKIPKSEEGGVGETGAEIPDWLDKQLWQNFKENRQKIKAPMTSNAEKLGIAKLKELKDQGNDPKAVIEQSIFNDWKGLFPIKNGNGHHEPQKEGELSERTQRILRRGL